MSDIKTPEFWVMVVTNIVSAAVAILAARGILTAEEGELWVQLAAAVVLPVALIVIGQVNRAYIAEQGAVKQARLRAGLRE